MFNFNRDWTQQMSDRNLGSSDGSSVASLLLGVPASTDSYVDYRDTFFRYRPYYAFYVQDDWKVTPTLTLNLGLRYDIQIPFAERYDRLNAGFAATTVNPLSDQILTAWNNAKTTYDASNPKYAFPAAPSGDLRRTALPEQGRTAETAV